MNLIVVDLFPQSRERLFHPRPHSRDFKGFIQVGAPESGAVFVAWNLCSTQFFSV